MAISSINKEETLQKWIFSLDDCGGAPQPSYVQEIANILPMVHESTLVQTVRKNGFITL